MEYILASNLHEIKNNCLRYTFQKPIRFQNQYISLTSMIFYNYFENITDKFKLTIKNKKQSHAINFKNGSYYTSDISLIINDEIKENFNSIDKKEKPIEIKMDVNRHAILIIVKKTGNYISIIILWIHLVLKKNIIEEGYHSSTKISNLDKTKFLKYIATWLIIKKTINF